MHNYRQYVELSTTELYCNLIIRTWETMHVETKLQTLYALLVSPCDGSVQLCCSSATYTYSD
jgi:hypothetical protein